MRVAASAFVCILALPLVSCNASRLPRIKNPDQLRKDCAILHEQFPVDETLLATNSGYRFFYDRGFPIGYISKEKWPTSIVALKPFVVHSTKYGIHIWITEVRREGPKGYFVPVTNSLPAPAAVHGLGGSYNLTPSPYEGIWEFFEPRGIL